MAKTAAERQVDYGVRQVRAANGERRLSSWVSAAAHLALARIANRYGVTRREMLERFIIAEDEKISAGLELETPAWNGYFERSLREASVSQSVPIKCDAFGEHGEVTAPSYGMLESRVVLLNAQNMRLADALQGALDEVAALKDALVDATTAKAAPRNGKSTLKIARRNT